MGQNEETDDVTGSELVDRWLDANRAWNMEGDSGLEKLEGLMRAVGYEGHPFRFGSPILQFLADNPGACHDIVSFIKGEADGNETWREGLTSALPEAYDLERDDEDELIYDDPDDGPPDSFDPPDTDGY